MRRVFPRGTPPEQIAAAVAVLVRDLDLTQSWQVSIERYKPKRSDRQNSFLWAVVYPSFLEGGGEMLAGWSKEDLHEYLLMEHFGSESLKIGGKVHHRPFRRSSGLSKIEFRDYIDFIGQRAAELGIVIPEPSYGESA